jgi:hypothetical protein
MDSTKIGKKNNKSFSSKICIFLIFNVQDRKSERERERERERIKKKINTVINETHWVCRESMKYALRNRTINQK